MKKVKYFLIGIMVMCTAFGLSACGSDSNDDANTTEATTVKKEVSTTAATKDTEKTTEPEADGKVHYTVKVVDESGNPVEGAMVQLCLESCFPSKTNAEGIAEFSLEEADYKVSFMTLPAGYTYSTEETEFHFENGSEEITITLKAE